MMADEWLECDDAQDMLCSLEGRKPSSRKLRLFATACCRLLMPLLTDERSRRVVEVAERYAEGMANDEELADARESARLVVQERQEQSPNVDWDELPEVLPSSVAEAVAIPDAMTAATQAGCRASEVASFYAESVSAASRFGWNAPEDFIAEAEMAARARGRSQVPLLVDLFTDHFRPMTLDPGWLTANVVGVARTIYEQRSFQQMPILADALEDAGCTIADILHHCRQPGEHVRGCWVLDLLLQRE